MSSRTGPGNGPGGAGPPANLDADYHVSDDVVASIAGLAAAEVPGVAGMGAGPGLGDVLGKRHPTRGVRVEIGTREVAVDVYVHVGYGERIPAVAQRVQEDVRRAVESMTGLRVVEVNVHVQGLSISPGRPALPLPRDRAEPRAEGPRPSAHPDRPMAGGGPLGAAPQGGAGPAGGGAPPPAGADDDSLGAG